MYARELRKWSLKYQMSYLWLSAVVTILLFIIYCPNATSMHLPINTNTRDTAFRIPPADSRGWWLDRLSSNRISSKHTNSDSSSNLSSSISKTNTNNFNSNNPLAVFSDFRNHNARASAPVNAAADTAADSINIENHSNTNTNTNNNNHQNHHHHNNTSNSNSNYYVPNVPNSNSQINLNLNPYANSLTRSAYDYSNSRSNKLRRHTNNQPNANYHSPVRVAVPMSDLSAPSTGDGIATSHIPPGLSPEPLFDEQRRRLLLRQQAHNRTLLAARSRRDSTMSGVKPGYLRNTSAVTSAGSYSYNYQQQRQHQQKHQHQHQHQHQHHKNNNNNNSNNNNNHHNNRKRKRRYCSAQDPAQLAFEAPTVFEGKIKSMSPDRRANFSVTVEVKEVFKQQIGFRLQEYLRLQFAYRNTSAECDIYREFLRPRGLVRGDELEQGRVYVMFVQQIDLGNFTILGQPIRKTRRVIEAVKNAVSENYAQLASIESITASNETVKNGKKLRIVCKVQGQPPPKVTWFKDHKSINRNRKQYQFIHYRRRSELIIRSFNTSDAGRYECRAKNKVNRIVKTKDIVIKAYPMPRYDAPTQRSGGKCPEDAYEFCFNGGTCKFFKEISSYSCICPEGFVGERCDRKEVNNMPPIPTYKTGYIADDPGVFDDDGTDSDSDENGEDEEDDDFIYPPTKDTFYNKFT